MTTNFRRRVGAGADVKELRYISALHQTCSPYLREDGTVSSLDVVRFLKSRGDLNVSKEHGLRIVRGLGGGVVSNDVIQQILQELKDPLQMQERKKERNIMDRIRLGESLGTLRKGFLKNTNTSQTDSSPDNLAATESKAVDASNQDPNKQPPTDSDVENPSDDKNAECEVYFDLLQIMAILLMPTLARAGKEWHDAQLPEAAPEEPPLPPTYVGLKGWALKLHDTNQAKEKEKEDEFNESLRPKPESIIPDVLETLLNSVHSDASSPPVVDAILVRKLLILHGECERAEDPVVIDKMVDAASSSSGLFDEEAFVNALTSDLSEWKVGAEDRNTSSFHDVWGYSNYYEKAVLEVKKEAAEQAAKEAAERGDEEQQGDASRDKEDKHHEIQDEGFHLLKSVTLDTVESTTSEEKAMGLTDAAVGIVQGAGTEGMNLAKEAGTGGANVVKGAQVGGAEVLQAEANLLADSPKFLHLRKRKKSGATEATGNEEASENEDETKYKLDVPRTLIAIDSATDGYSSSLLMVGIFVFFICTALVYGILFLQMPAFEPDCGEQFACILVDKIIFWAIFAVFLSLVGYFVIIPLSTGNNPVERSPLINSIAFIAALVLTWIPYAAVEIYKDRRVEEPYDEPEVTVTADDYSGAQLVTLIVGLIVAALILIQFFLALIGNRRIRQHNLLSRILLTSVAKGGGRSKRAATRKINRLLHNASSMRPKKSTEETHTDLDVSELVMINFVIRGETFEDCGGLIWTWKQLLSRDLFEEEGVWIMSRLLIIQTIQALFIGFKSYALVLFIEEVLRRCEEWQDDLELWPDLPQWVYDFVPTPYQARIALWPAFTTAVIIMFVIFFIYLPSYVRRVIQFRCGMIPSLDSEGFCLYRESVDLVYTNIGNALYAMFGAALLFFFMVGLTIFLFIWPATKNFMILLLAWGLGLCITICIKYVIQVFWRYRFYAGLYRLQPRKANLTQLGFETWYIGLGGGVLVSRFLQFILAACFFVGRTDVPFLSADVSLFGYVFDYAPQSFVKDILVHEAHRHPYIERLYAMYMMKLKNDSFCSEAGACWRQLFVASLMPWFVRHRVFSDERLGNSRHEYNTRRREGQSPLQMSQHEAMHDHHSSLETSQINPEMSKVEASQVTSDKQSPTPSQSTVNQSPSESAGKQSPVDSQSATDQPVAAKDSQSRPSAQSARIMEDVPSDEELEDSFEISTYG